MYSDDIRNELKHHGVLGMKWGIRKYQRPDGTLTARGKKRYAKQESKNTKLQAHADREVALEKARKEIDKVYDPATGGRLGKYTTNKAAKYVVDHNMSYKDAKLLANKRAKQVTGVVAAVAAINVLAVVRGRL